MFRPLDTLTFDTDWPVMQGRIKGLRDARVVVLQRPGEDMEYPCNVVVTSVSGNSLTFALAARTSSTVYTGTSLTVAAADMSVGKSYRSSNAYMIVDIAVDGNSFVPTGVTPFQIIPCCVVWIPPVGTAFNSSTLPETGSGWSREIDYSSKRVIYSGWAPGSVSEDRPPDDETVVRLRSLNGLSASDVRIVPDGDGQVDTDEETGVITLRPALRDLDDARRTL